MAGKSDVIVKLILVFFISLLSFSVGTFVGKKYSDNQHQLAKLEPSEHASDHNTEIGDHPSNADESHGSTGHASGHDATQNEKMSDEEIAKLGQEFVNDEEAPSAHGEKANSHNSEHNTAENTHDEANTHDKPEMNAHNDAKTAEHEVQPSSVKTPEKRVAIKPSSTAHDIAFGNDHSRSTASIQPHEVTTPGKFTIQIAAFPNEQEAQGKANELKNKGLGAFYIPALVNGKTWYRVSIGQFATQEEAIQYRSNIIKEGKVASAMIQKIQ